MVNNTLNVPDMQKATTLNVDENILSKDYINQSKEGCPTVMFYDRLLPDLGQTISKMSPSTSLIIGSTTFGEVGTPRFQFLTMTDEDLEKN